jgi:hypothetical protein
VAKKPDPPPRESRVTVPERCDPRAKIVFAEMRRQGVTYDELEYRSNVLRSTVKSWRKAKKPGLDTIEACLGSLGWGLVPVPRMEHLPPDLQAALEDLGRRFGEHMPLLPQLLATVSRIPILGEFHARAAAGVVPIRRKRRQRGMHPDQVHLLDIEHTEQAA